MRRLLGLLAFLAGGVCAEAVHPLQCELVPATRRTASLPERSRSRGKTGPAGAGRLAQHSSL